MTKLIVGRAFLRIAENLIGLIDFLKLFFRARRLVDIRMVLFSQLAIGFFYFIIRSAFADAQDFILLLLYTFYESIQARTAGNPDSRQPE